MHIVICLITVAEIEEYGLFLLGLLSNRMQGLVARISYSVQEFAVWL